MVGTAEDFLVFLETLRKGGSPILRRETVDIMTTNQIGDFMINPERFGWGFGFGAAAILGTFGRLDILINNAGGSRPVKTGLGTPEEWEEGMRLNFDAGRNLAHAVVDSMQAQKFGRIINLTGTQEPLGFNAAIPPNGAVTIWSKLLAGVVAKDGVTVNCISPGIVHSEQIDERVFRSVQEQEDYAGKEIPVGYIGEAEDVALMAVFLCSPRARYITGEVIYVDGGAKRYPH
jgi:3-oxoacyl-[acyl-carrier protein] reductase